MTISERLRALAENTKEYCKFLEEELTNLKGVGRALERLAADIQQLETTGVVTGGAVPSVSGAAPLKEVPAKEKSGGNRCNYPIF